MKTQPNSEPILNMTLKQLEQLLRPIPVQQDERQGTSHAPARCPGWQCLNHMDTDPLLIDSTPGECHFKSQTRTQRSSKAMLAPKERHQPQH